MANQRVINLNVGCLRELSTAEKRSLDDKMYISHIHHTGEPVVLLEDIPVEDLEPGPVELNTWKVKDGSKANSIVVYVGRKYGATAFIAQKKGPNNFDQKGKRKPEEHSLLALPREEEVENLVEQVKIKAYMDVIKNSNLKPEEGIWDDLFLDDIFSQSSEKQQ